MPGFVAVRLRNPRAVRDGGDGARETLGAHFPRHEIAVNHKAARGFEQTPGHGKTIVIGPHFERAHAPRVFERRGAAVAFGFVEVRVPIAAPDREVGHEVVQIGFVHDHDTGVTEGRFISKSVPGIVADVIKGNVAGRGIEGRSFAVEHGQTSALAHLSSENFRVIGDAALRRRHGGEESGDPHRAQRINSMENLPMASGAVMSRGVRAGSRA